jgi:hypothetical protein
MEQQEVALPKDITAKQLLQMAYRRELELTPQQFNAAKVCLEYEEAKLSAVAMGVLDKTDFASMLERAILRSKDVPRALPAPAVEHSRDEVRRPFSRMRRNLR